MLQRVCGPHSVCDVRQARTAATTRSVDGPAAINRIPSMTRRRATSNRPTLATVAEAVGVSMATVSRALAARPHPDISTETRERIQAAAREIGYSPSAAARSLRTGRSHSLCLVVSARDWIWWGPISVGVEGEARKRGYTVRLEMWDPADDSPEVLAKRLGSAVDDGVIAIDMGPIPDLASILHPVVPVVFVDDVNELPDQAVVAAANEDGGYQATRHLIETGRRVIAGVFRAGNYRYVRERHAGYRAALLDAGLEYRPELVTFSDLPWDEPLTTSEPIERLLERNAGIDAVFASTDYLAAAVLRALHARSIEVPDRVAVVGFDDERAATLVHPNLTTIRQPFAELGSAAVRLIDEALSAEQPVRRQRIELPVELVVRESSRPTAE
jgi:LacI family transcriptional regulator